jgi:hypothetical protein
LFVLCRCACLLSCLFVRLRGHPAIVPSCVRAFHQHRHVVKHVEFCVFDFDTLICRGLRAQMQGPMEPVALATLRVWSAPGAESRCELRHRERGPRGFGSVPHAPTTFYPCRSCVWRVSLEGQQLRAGLPVCACKVGIADAPHVWPPFLPPLPCLRRCVPTHL